MFKKVLAFSLMCLVVNSFDKVTFTELPGHRLTSVSLTRLSTANKIQCVRACKRSPMCTSVNFGKIRNTNNCELVSESTSNTVNVLEDHRIVLLCE